MKLLLFDPEPAFYAGENFRFVVRWLILRIGARFQKVSAVAGDDLFTHQAESKSSNHLGHKQVILSALLLVLSDPPLALQRRLGTPARDLALLLLRLLLLESRGKRLITDGHQAPVRRSFDHADLEGLVGPGFTLRFDGVILIGGHLRGLPVAVLRVDRSPHDLGGAGLRENTER